MKLLIEEYRYDVADVVEVLDGLFTLQDVEQRVAVGYVGYYYNPHPEVRDVVFILPKVLIDERGLVFGKYDPARLIHLDEAEILPHERKFLYEFAVWIHRAIVVFNHSHPANEIVLHRQLEQEGTGRRKKKSNTLLDVILSLIRFNKEHRHYFTFILKNLHSGFNKINWGKTIAGTTAVVQEGNPSYLHPVNKRRQINFDEELIVIFFSILNYVGETYGFRAEIGYGFPLITGARFRRYLDGYGRTRLRRIKYKYFSDTAVKLWDLCYAFFDKAYLIRMSVAQNEYLLVKAFHIVFEAMIDELIGTPHDRLPAGLADQYDGKVVDHFYTYGSLLTEAGADSDIYYIGDSKYYKLGNSLGTESIFKQRTYARNVIQWNLDIWLDGEGRADDPFERIRLFDEVTEGYNIIPNFFISAAIDKETLSYEDRTEPHRRQPPVSRQFRNRLYDRDTLLLSHYDVNFLFVLSLYARDNAAAKAAWRETVRAKFRTAIRKMLREKFDFYAMSPHPDVDAPGYFRTHFRDTLGKTFRPYRDGGVYSLALDRAYPEDNRRLLASLGENFYVVPVELGEDPSGALRVARSEKGAVRSPGGMGGFLFGVVNKQMRDEEDGRQRITREYMAFSRREATRFVMRRMPGGDIMSARYFVPLFDGGIAGYYEIEGITFGVRTEPYVDPQTGLPVRSPEGEVLTVQLPCLNIRLGGYTPLGDATAAVPNLRKWNGQIHTLPEVEALYRAGIPNSQGV